MGDQQGAFNTMLFGGCLKAGLERLQIIKGDKLIKGCDKVCAHGSRDTECA